MEHEKTSMGNLEQPTGEFLGRLVSLMIELNDTGKNPALDMSLYGVELEIKLKYLPGKTLAKAAHIDSPQVSIEQSSCGLDRQVSINGQAIGYITYDYEEAFVFKPYLSLRSEELASVANAMKLLND
ncbi:hypothetical protein [Pseudoalteromonas sp. OOF1S-7]|uniref:hypothetical protein n=1 Tax=Pseudoalteromonas sp. OOF1S-7 TaxID=2917757 RepID=UPI001EF419C4|nr:hypothetical protein [Pseudoalteromonas sp. OOF1S-7]MCG7537909.1 hypothetical protein [Pseudoalteromonas sp. OOF1S-7]